MKKQLRKRTHPNFPNYNIYENGKIENNQQKIYSNQYDKWVYNRNYLKVMKQRIHPQTGSRMVDLVDKDGIQRTCYPHVLVIECFKGRSTVENKTIVTTKTSI